MIYIVAEDNVLDTKSLFLLTPVNSIGVNNSSFTNSIFKRHKGVKSRYLKKTECYRLKSKGDSRFRDCFRLNPYIQIRPGRVYKERVNNHKGHYRYLLLFPISYNPKGKLKYRYLIDSLRELIRRERELVITSIAIPPIEEFNNMKRVYKILIEELVNSTIPTIELYVPKELKEYVDDLLDKEIPF